MKKVLGFILSVVKGVLASGILLLALATFFGGSYGQTICLVLAATFLLYWPTKVRDKLGNNISAVVRTLTILSLLAIKQWVFVSEPKTSIYKTESYKKELMAEYRKCMQAWPSSTTERYLTTQYGKVHVLEVGKKENPPLVMLHAASMGAHSWAENLPSVLEEYHIYAIDNIGEGNKSELDNALVFPDSPKEIADFYLEIFDKLEIDSAIVFGASNGGYIAQTLAYNYPEKVEKMVLFGPMGLTQLTNTSIAMMSLATMYPLQFLRDAVADWAIGTAAVCHEKYGAWFNVIMKGTIPSVSAPVPMTIEQKQVMDLPILLFLGTNDRIVGDAQIAKEKAGYYPNIQIEILNSGHLMAVEKSEIINQKTAQFLKN